MQTRNPVLDDLARVASGALGVAAGLREEMEQRLRDHFARILAGMNLPEREEFEAVREMAAIVRTEQEGLSARVAALEARLAALEGQRGSD